MKERDMTLKKILCIDDEEDITEVAGMALETLGNLEVLKSNSGSSGIEKATNLQPDLILLDVMMPEMDGPATLGKILSNPDIKHIPVIFMTARVQPKEIQEYIDMGAIGVIEKPFDPMSLYQTIKNIWNEK